MNFKTEKIYIALIVILILVLSSGILFVNKNRVLTTKVEENTQSSQEAENEQEKIAKEMELDQQNRAIQQKNEELQKLQNIKNDPLMILINRNNSVDSEFVPENLVLSEFNFVSGSDNRSLLQVTADAAKKMFEAAYEEGIILLGVSGYRSYYVQESLYYYRVYNEGQAEADRYTAKPGQSEHQVGLALDILSEDYQSLDINFDNTEAYRWLKDNCYKYGFILRYPLGKEEITGFSYEPWHYRYIGNSDIAKEIMDKNITFEEYIEELNSKIELLS